MPEQTNNPKEDLIDTMIALSLLTRRMAQILAEMTTTTTKMKGANENG